LKETDTEEAHFGGAFPASHLKADIKESKAGTKIIILDCCYSGAYKNSDKGNKNFQRFSDELSGVSRGTVCLAACGGTEKAKQGIRQENIKLSVFTQFLINGIKELSLGTEPIRHIHINDVFDYIKKSITELKKKRPNDPQIQNISMPELPEQFGVRGEIALCRTPDYQETIDKLNEYKREINKLLEQSSLVEEDAEKFSALIKKRRSLPRQYLGDQERQYFVEQLSKIGDIAGAKRSQLEWGRLLEEILTPEGRYNAAPVDNTKKVIDVISNYQKEVILSLLFIVIIVIPLLILHISNVKKYNEIENKIIAIKEKENALLDTVESKTKTINNLENEIRRFSELEKAYNNLRIEHIQTNDRVNKKLQEINIIKEKNNQFVKIISNQEYKIEQLENEKLSLNETNKKLENKLYNNLNYNITAYEECDYIFNQNNKYEKGHDNNCYISYTYGERSALGCYLEFYNKTGDSRVRTEALKQIDKIIKHHIEILEKKDNKGDMEYIKLHIAKFGKLKNKISCLNPIVNYLKDKKNETILTLSYGGIFFTKKGENRDFQYTKNNFSYNLLDYRTDINKKFFSEEESEHYKELFEIVYHPKKDDKEKDIDISEKLLSIGINATVLLGINKVEDKNILSAILIKKQRQGIKHESVILEDNLSSNNLNCILQEYSSLDSCRDKLAVWNKKIFAALGFDDAKKI
ncbi:MAG: hypothetical protein D3905_12185, partial [Candidatus Electrothrix sp. AS4_5]|nr:hypothetical protein [Candidatus Electrothrix gigas]